MADDTKQKSESRRKREFDALLTKLKQASGPVLSNVILLIAIVTAFIFSESLEMVATAPTRYSAIVIPFTIGAIIASITSFLVYLDLPMPLRLVPYAGACLAGVAIALICTSFMGPLDEWSSWPDGKIDTVVPRYLSKISLIGWMILAFAFLTFVSSLLKARDVEERPERVEYKDTVHGSSFYWVLKAFVCDFPIVIGAGIILFLQYFYQDASHPNYTEVYYKIFNEPTGERVLASPACFAAVDTQRVLSNSNFWIGVALGVTSAQLILQQLSSLALEIVLIRQRKVQ
ncbi:MAG: hypothetical protein QNI84_10275 [Henriciella sp.]|nr:hypothetical protein [Henriciella sp.]